MEFIKKIIFLLLPEKVSKLIKYKKFSNNKCLIGDYCDIDSISKLGKSVIITHHASIRECEINDYSSIGKYSKLAYVNIGKFCSISWDVTIGAISHPYDRISSHAFPYVKFAGNFVDSNNFSKSETYIGNDVWIGCNSVIISGIKIGNGAIIGAGAVVTKDVPAYAIIAGVPGKIIGYRFDSPTINLLQNIKWWDWKHETIKDNIDIFQNKLNQDIISRLKNISNESLE